MKDVNELLDHNR